jgi:hypothetical protein
LAKSKYSSGKKVFIGQKRLRGGGGAILREPKFPHLTFATDYKRHNTPYSDSMSHKIIPADNLNKYIKKNIPYFVPIYFYYFTYQKGGDVLGIDVSRALPSVVALVQRNINNAKFSLSLECVWRYLRDDTY